MTHRKLKQLIVIAFAINLYLVGCGQAKEKLVIEEETYVTEINSVETEEISEESDQPTTENFDEVKYHWELHKEDDLASAIEGGLTYEEFEKNYSFYRGALDEVMTPDNAYQLTLLEVNRLFAAVSLDYEALDTTKNMIKNSDGTYTYSEEFIGTITSLEYFEGATDEEIEEFLQSIGFLIEDLPGSAVIDFMGLYEGGNLHSENETIKQSEGTVAEENSNSNTGNSTSNSGNSNSGSSGASDNSGSSGGGSMDSVFDNPSGFGGGELTDLPEGYTGIH